MSISMIGIDHSMAPVDIRALFAFTRKNAGEAMEKLKEQRGIDGCIFLHAIAWRYGQVWMMRQSFLYIKSFVN